MPRDPVDREIVARYLETVGKMVDFANLDPGVIERLLEAFEHHKINLQGTSRHIWVTPAERQIIKALTARAIAARGGRFHHEGLVWISDEARGLRRTLPWD
jgi:hypothetical protein